MTRLVTRILPLIFICLAFAGTVSAQIYADVALGGAVSGTFTIHLEDQKAPVAVANFIGLATGSKGWLDLNTGTLRYDPYYNGLIFHRVIANFMSQTGSRSGDGTDGPGYTFQNEITSLSHATPYTVAMANSGGASTNGAQWYITANSSQSFLDGSYTIFGEVTSGTAVCNALNNVSTSGGGGSPADRPLTPVNIRSITIYGPSLASFNLNPNALPKVLGARPVMKVSGSNYTLGFDHNAFSYYYRFDSPDLQTWTNSWTGYFHRAAPAPGDQDVTSLSTGGKHFFKMARVDYRLCYNSFVPDSLAGKTVHFSPPLGGSLVVNAPGTGGTWAFDGSASSSLTYYSYSVFPYWGNPVLQLANNMVFAIDHLEYTSATGGIYNGRTNVNGFSNITGTFTSSP